MFRFIVSLKKETLLFLSDKVGLVLMFGMPVILVFVITIIQDSVYQILDSNRISMLIVNHDAGELGKRLVSQIDSSGMFKIEVDNSIRFEDIKSRIAQKKVLTAVCIPSDFSKKLQSKSSQLSSIILTDFGLSDAGSIKLPDIETITIQFFHDPVLQESFCYSVLNILRVNLSVIESSRMIENIYEQMGVSSDSSHLKEIMQKNRISINRIVASQGTQNEIPSSTQHNVPAWTIFAMFFMVVSLGTNIVKERTTGSFLRIKTIPGSFTIVLLSKQVIYTIIAFLQVLVIFSIGLFILPLINLPPLEIPENISGILVVVFVCSFAAVSYALMIGTLANTADQSNGFGAISIIIFAALGGVWVPTFIMPHYLQVISLLSPLHWCIESFYVLFLKHGNWSDLGKPVIVLLSFSLLCQSVAYMKIKLDQ